MVIDLICFEVSGRISTDIKELWSLNKCGFTELLQLDMKSKLFSYQIYGLGLHSRWLAHYSKWFFFSLNYLLICIFKWLMREPFPSPPHLCFSEKYCREKTPSHQLSQPCKEIFTRTKQKLDCRNYPQPCEVAADLFQENSS